MHGLAIQKLLNKPKKVHQHCCPSDEEKRQQQKSNQSCDQPDEQHPINGSGIIRPAHTTKRCKHSHTNQPNKIIGTLSSSHTTHAHPNTPHYPGPAQSGLSDPTHTHTTNKIAVKCGSSERIYQRSFSYRHLTRTTARRGVVGHADSHKATHTQPTTQICRLTQLSTPFLWQG